MLIARDHAERAFPLVDKTSAVPSHPVWVSEAVKDLYGLAPGMAVDLPLLGKNHRFTVAGRVTASFGVAACPRSGVDSLELLDSADKALDIAKKAGRRRVAVLEAPHVH